MQKLNFCHLICIFSLFLIATGCTKTGEGKFHMGADTIFNYFTQGSSNNSQDKEFQALKNIPSTMDTVIPGDYRVKGVQGGMDIYARGNELYDVSISLSDGPHVAGVEEKIANETEIF